MTVSPADFMKGAKAAPINSNTPWGARYARVLRDVFETQAAWAPRTLQVHLGPSELGVECDRQVAGKLLGLPPTNHVVDPWPSILGTAAHAWAALAFEADNIRTGQLRWLAETRVTPLEGHSGTADLYDAVEAAVVDHKFLGETTLAHVKRASGPPRKYKVQLILYGRGYRLAGLPVKRVVLAAYPRTAATLNRMYVWDHELTAEDDELINQVYLETEHRKDLANRVRAGQLTFNQIPNFPSHEECYFCPFYRPQSATDGGVGCPGTAADSTSSYLP